MRERLINLLIASGAAALLCCGWCGYEIGRTSRETRFAVAEIRKTVVAVNAKDGILARLDKAALHIEASTKEMGDIGAQALRASKAQTDALAKENVELTGFIHDGRTALNETKQQMIDSLKAVTGDVHAITDDVGGTARAATTALNAVPPVLNSLHVALDKAAELIGDQDIKTALMELAKTAKNTDDITAGIAKIITDVQGRIDAMQHPSRKKRMLQDAIGTLKLLYYLSQIKW